MRAVFITYVAFNSPHVEVAPRLINEYSRAVEELSSAELPRYFAEHVNRLIGHLVGLALPGATGDPEWQQLLRRALAAGPAEGVAQVVHDLAFSMRRENLDVPAQWLLDLARQQAEGLGQRSGSAAMQIARAWLELILAARFPVTSVGGVLIALTHIGASAEENDLVEYLTAIDRPRSRTGARLLRDAVEAGAFDGYVRNPSTLKRLVLNHRCGRTLAIAVSLAIVGTDVIGHPPLRGAVTMTTQPATTHRWQRFGHHSDRSEQA